VGRFMHLCRAQGDPRAESGTTAPAARSSTSRAWTSYWPSPGSAAPAAQVVTVSVGEKPLGCVGVFCERAWNW
jgi:hypothetical protein